MPRKAKCPTPGKVCFRDEIAAKIVLMHRGKGDHRRETTERRVYRCKCGWVHLTSSPKAGEH